MSRKSDDPFESGPLSAGMMVVAPARCLLDRWVDRVLELAGPDAEVRRFFPQTYPRDPKQLLEDLLAELAGASLFAPRRVVVHHGSAPLRDKGVQAWWKEPTPNTTLLLVVLSKGPRDKPPAIPKGLDIAQKLDPGPASPGERARYLEAVAKRRGCSLERGVVELLEEFVGDALDPLVQKVEQLCLYRGDGKVSGDDVAALIGRSAGRDLDRLVRAMLRGDARAALETLEAIAEEGLVSFGGGRIHGRQNTASAILPQLFSRIRRVASVSGPAARRDAVVEALGLHPYFAKKLGEEAQALGAARLGRWLDACLVAEVEQKRVGEWKDEDLLLALVRELSTVAEGERR